MPTKSNDSLLRKYLLGDLPAEERTRIEDEYLVDAERLQELVGVENDLIDSYARGTLSDLERLQFEQCYGNGPEGRVRIDFAKALTEVSRLERDRPNAAPASPKRSFLSYFAFPRPQLRWALACAAVLTVGVFWMAFQNRTLRRELQQARVDATQMRREQEVLRNQIAELQSQSQRGEQGSEVAHLEMPADLTFSLMPGSVRSGDLGKSDLVIRPSHPWVRLEMKLDRGGYKTYEAVLLTAEGSEILRGKGLNGRLIGNVVVVSWRVATRLLPASDYVVHLRGERDDGKTEQVQSYSFRTVQE